MNPRSSTQDLIRCELCEIAVVEMHCDACLIKLCKACVGEHCSANLSKSHKIVATNVKNSTLNNLYCQFHENELCEMYCNQCTTPICTACISSGIHIQHNISQIRRILDDKRRHLKKENEYIKQNIYPTYLGILSEVKHKMSQLEKKYGYLSTAITKHGETWHKKIDILVNKLKSKANEMKKIHFDAFKKHQQHIEEKMICFDRTLSSQEKILDSNEISLLLGYKSHIPKLQKLPAKISDRMPHFTPWNCEEGQFIKVFGKLTTLFITSDEHGYKMKTPQQSPEIDSSPLFKYLLDKPETANLIKTEYGYLYNVVCRNDEKIWTSGNDREMKLFGVNKGSLLQSITTTSGKDPYDITLTKGGDLVFTDSRDKTVNIVRNGKIDKLITLQNWRPLCVCRTFHGDLLVTMDNVDNKHSKVVRYSDSTEIQAIQFDDEGNPLYFPNDKYVSENKNLDICVAVNGAETVVVVDHSGKLRFRYIGHELAPKDKPFSPRGITTDSQSHILTADDKNDCVHIIDKDGQFLCYIDCGLSDPRGLCTDANDNLFIAQGRSKEVKIIKYQY
ncbi:E3 ubiquitin-protein ligase TRIM71-like [Saccostrea echinata]|uniref:E3 ubiquitin-protein ligase TRIM71-like n=1 Tax=Saccostrea echinata TaxID=191078 RepID=UPI002A83E4B9|nr:E3 ubiquitin-protein ligase TRIM71-like [Saccostrea echinata]